MSLRTSANRYAKALCDVALEEKADLEKIGTDLSEVEEVLGNPELQQAAARAVVPDAARVAMIEEIADRLGVTRERVRQIEQQALTRLRRAQKVSDESRVAA